MSESLIHLAYISQATTLMDDSQLERLLEKARENNLEKDITGMLLYSDGAFLQIIEGTENNLNDTYDIIVQDNKHHRITQLFKKPITERDFGDWTMGYRRLSSDDIGDIPGMNHILEGTESLEDYILSSKDSAATTYKVLLFFKRAA